MSSRVQIGSAVAIGALASTLVLSAVHAGMQQSTGDANDLAGERSKTVRETSIAYSCKISPEHCDEHGRVYGGELLKLIDVAAGIVAAKHHGGPCLTISLDRVIFLLEIKVSDVVHLSVAVNRAWGSSMEIGVRVMRETPESPVQTYCCHAYLTFVAKPTVPPPPSPITSLLASLHLTTLPKPVRAKVPSVNPITTLENKRYLLAGRRRAHRIQGRTEHDALLTSFRAQVLEIEREIKESQYAATTGKDDESKEDVIASLQKEMIVEAFMREDPDVKVEEGFVVASIEGFMEPIKVPLKEVQKASAQRGKGGYRRLSVPQDDEEETSTRHKRLNSRELTKAQIERTLIESTTPLDMADTLAVGLWIVRPQHCNSKNILFGGALIRWIEEISSVAARRVAYCPWSSASVDSLTFMSAVKPGEVVQIRACVVKVWDSSVEIYALALAEDRNSPKPTVRLVSDSFFSMVAIDPNSGRPLKGRLRHVNVPEGPAQKVAAGSDKRRADRLQDKRILQRVYA